jgi:hypothetical protein
VKQKPQIGSGPAGDAPAPVEDALLKTRVPLTLLRLVNRHAALGATTLDDFVREAIEEALRSS